MQNFTKSLYKVIPEGSNRSKPLAGVLYTCIQSVAFTVLAIMIMRMKLFMTPQLCIVASLLCNAKLFNFITTDKRTAFVVMLFAVATLQGKLTVIQLKHSLYDIGAENILQSFFADISFSRKNFNGT